MSTISSVDTSFYPGLVEGFAPTTMQAVPAIEAEPQGEAAEYSGSGNFSQGESYADLSNYYNDVKPEDLLTKAGQYLIESAQKIDNTMVIAMQNGYSVQDVCNIRLAEMAYKASAYVFDVAEEISTFALDV